ncbi:MAG: GNAT family N-acetyltransferase [Pseudomonadales bacterium]
MKNPRIELDPVTDPAVITLLKEHLLNMQEVSPPESTHALAVDELREPSVSCWSMWYDNKLAGVGALKELSATHGEIKSMRTAQAYLRRGVAASILETIIAEARSRGYQRLSLETGSYTIFEPARRLYQRYGFEYCGPFADYSEDPHSNFMSLNLSKQ